MNKVFENFKRYIEPFGLNEADFNTLIQQCEIVEFPKGTMIMKAGEKQDAVYYIFKGIVRNCVDTLGGEITTYGFRNENLLITGYGLHNFIDQFKALVSVESLVSWLKSHLQHLNSWKYTLRMHIKLRGF